jgi:chromosomal replication initiator protein
VLRHFLAGPENRLVEVAVRSVLLDQDRLYNPVLLYGPTGVGKSHLARGIAAQWRTRSRRSRVVCTPALDFARELSDAIQTQAMDDLRARYYKAELLVLEDIGDLASQPAAQEELVNALDVLLAEGSWVVLTAPAAPAEMTELLPALQSRVSSGLTVRLSLPGPDARRVLLQRLAKLHRIKLPQSVARILAEGLDETVQGLDTAVAHLEMLARLNGGTIDVDTARLYLARRSGALPPDLGEIATATAQFFSLKLSDLRGPSRRRALVSTRGIAMYLARRLTGMSFEQIGRYFGGRDRTTTMHACRKTEDLLKSDPGVRRSIQALQERWQTV